MIRPTDLLRQGAGTGAERGGLPPADGAVCGAVPVTCHYAHLCPPTVAFSPVLELPRGESAYGV